MKFINLFLIAALGITFSYAKGKVDCDDPKNRPNYIGGIMVSGKKECMMNRGGKELDGTIGRNPVTGKVTSKAELAGADNATMNLETAQMNLETAQMNFGKAQQTLKDAEEAYEDDASVKNSRRVDKARKAFEKAQRDLEAAEEIKEKGQVACSNLSFDKLRIKREALLIKFDNLALSS